jgi:hypothetical protein
VPVLAALGAEDSDATGVLVAVATLGGAVDELVGVGGATAVDEPHAARSAASSSRRAGVSTGMLLFYSDGAGAAIDRRAAERVRKGRVACARP